MFSHSLASPVAIMVAGERTAVYPPENVARVLPGRTLAAHCWSCYSQWDCKRKSSYTYAQQNHYLQLCIQTLRNTYCCGIVDGWEYEWASRWPEGIWTDPPYPGEICESGTLDRWIKKKKISQQLFSYILRIFNAKHDNRNIFIGYDPICLTFVINCIPATIHLVVQQYCSEDYRCYEYCYWFDPSRWHSTG